jgi:prevent-host-death family protein
MDSIGAFEAKTQFSQLLERVEGGEQIVITRRGVPVARLVPVGRRSRDDIAQTVQELREFSAGVCLNSPGGEDTLAIRDLIYAGRQW